MAQGSAKLASKKKSAGALRRKVVRKKTVTKGKKQFQNKRSPNLDQMETTKAINRRNEKMIAAKAVSAGTQFFLTDISDKGEKEMKANLRARDKKQSKTTSSKLRVLQKTTK